MICMPTGMSSSFPTGAHTTGKPMQEIGWVSRPALGRAGTSRPRTVIISWPIRCAVRGVAGARTTSTVWNSFTTFP